ncbi:hypothetical protein [Fusobacterium gastrosuis]|uniref:hypothetical protein n=1 Tax=Fusobacterium gastrosuis TaxID=1755100 RepID=UPI00297ACB8F|nr:hypothetical protein [Fusobacteriaceae bacterium]MDY5714084.1 hypothetical protein [Fusobacterium gastrosuis]
MKDIINIGFLSITKYDTLEIKSYFLKVFEFNLSEANFKINLIENYKKMYQKKEEKKVIVKAMLEILQILNEQKHALTFIEDDHTEFKEKLKRLDFIFCFDIEEEIALLNFAEKFRINDIKQIFKVNLEDIIIEVNSEKKIENENDLLNILFKFILEKLKKVDENLLNILSGDEYEHYRTQ